MRAIVIAILFWAAAQGAFAADFMPATAQQAAAALTADDVYMRTLTPADLSIRLHEPGGGTLAELRRAYAGATLEWSDAEKARLAAVIVRHRAPLDALARWLPPVVYFAKTTDGVEGGLPHTRGVTIFLGPRLPAGDTELDSLVLHELFHVLSRRNEARHDELYAVIGFRRCAALDLPGALRRQILTNPDAPIVNYVVYAGDTGLWITPVALLSPPHFDPAKPKFTDYFMLHFFEFRQDRQGRCTPLMQGGAPVEEPPGQAAAMIFSHAGRNTTYLLHPEELLADDFSQMLMARADAPSPEVYGRLAAFLGITAPAPAKR